MWVIGIVGGVASGKSFVAGYFRNLGAEIVDVDEVGHQVLRDPDVIAAVARRWGPEVIGKDGYIDRRAVARIVFSPPPEGPRQLIHLEQITHPPIAERLERQIAQARAQSGARAVVLDAAVLIKAGWHRLCDKIVFVDAPRELRLERSRQRGWTDDEFAAREAAQPPLTVQREAADVVMDNSTSPEWIQAEVKRFWTSLSK